MTAAHSRSNKDSAIRDSWERLRRDGYVAHKADALGFDRAFRDHLKRRYFDTKIVHRQVPDTPADRERARGVIHYQLVGKEGVHLRPHNKSSMKAALSGYESERHYQDVNFLGDRWIESWARLALGLVPPENRQHRGTLGINLLRTHTDVVKEAHQDQEEYVLIFVLAKNCGGAETILYEQTGEVAFRKVLEPGEILLFNDERFLHRSTPLEPFVDPPFRDTMICTVDDPTSYKMGPRESHLRETVPHVHLAEIMRRLTADRASTV